MKFPLRLALLCLIVCISSCVGLKLAVDAGRFYCIWLGNAVVIAFVITAPSRWKLVTLALGELVSLATQLALGSALWITMGCAAANAAGVLLPVLGLGHFSGRQQVTSRASFLRILYFGMFLGPTAGAAIGASFLAAVEGQPLPRAFLFWFLAQSLSAAVGIPSVLLLLTREARHRGTLARRAPAICIWCTPLLLVSSAVFWQTTYPIVFLVIPPLVAVIFRFKLAGAIFGTFFVVLSGAVATSEGHGPFRLAHGDAPTEQVMLFHLFGLALFATCVAVGFAVEERVQFERALKSVNRNLHDLALLDSLTGVQNRRGFEEAMQLAWSNALAAGQDVSLLYLDIDFFKLFNDAYGHQQGDECLTAVAAALVGTARAGVDCVARYGGEEFVVILPGTSADAARVAAERIQAAVLSLRIPHRDSPFGVISISLGLATLRPTPESAPAALIHLADEALYGAKRNGRNRIESHPVGGPSRSSANAYAPTAIASLVPNLDTQIPVRGSAS